MESINHIQEVRKVYLSNYHISCGNFKISDNTLEKALISLTPDNFDYRKIQYSIDYWLTKPMTFTDCYNKQHDVFYWYLPRKRYTLSFLPSNIKYFSNSVVDNANLLATINGIDITQSDAYKMRYWFILVARIWAYRKVICGERIISYDMTINEFLDACCNTWWNKFREETIVEDMKKKSIKNCGCKTITRGGNLSAAEKNSISHRKYDDSKRDLVIHMKFVEGKSYNDIAKVTGILRTTVQKICNTYKKREHGSIQQLTPGSIQQPGISGSFTPGSIQQIPEEKITVPTLNSNELYSLECKVSGSIQQPATLQANQANQLDAFFKKNDLYGNWEEFEI